jgi:hypothetical protein
VGSANEWGCSNSMARAPASCMAFNTGNDTERYACPRRPPTTKVRKNRKAARISWNETKGTKPGQISIDLAMRSSVCKLIGTLRTYLWQIEGPGRDLVRAVLVRLVSYHHHWRVIVQLAKGTIDMTKTWLCLCSSRACVRINRPVCLSYTDSAIGKKSKRNLVACGHEFGILSFHYKVCENCVHWGGPKETKSPTPGVIAKVLFIDLRGATNPSCLFTDHLMGHTIAAINLWVFYIYFSIFV